jgi:multiple sugar transport system permease protein
MTAIRGRFASIEKRKAIQGTLAVIPVILILLVVRAYPIIVAFIKSFTNWNGLYQNDWVGVRNYVDLVVDEPFFLLLRNNFVLLINVPLQVFFGLIVALLLHEKAWGWRFFRSLYYIPQIISAVIIGYLFRILFGYEGPINLLLQALGASSAAIEWLGSGGTALFVIVVCIVWFSIGWQAIVILGGLSAIPDSVFEAARIDGANFWQRTFKIAVPMLVRVLEYAVIMSSVWTFTGLFPFIYALTKGGPGYETTTLDYMVYIKSFVKGVDLGEACAIAVVLLFIIMILTVIEMRITNRQDDWS